MTLTRSDRLLRLVSLLCLAAVGFALISQHAFGMKPCAWCVLQRLILLAIAAVCGLAGMGWGPAIVRRGGAVAAAILAGCGIAAAWYQYSVAAQLFSCAQTFADRFITASGLDAALPWLFGIYASCNDARVSLLGVEYALWGLALFVVCAALTLATLWMSPDADQSPAD
ncbi:disulfide bond formation protein B [Castellaniella daejeonensis]|jgi:disulfide bond formation protein DsbB|uniref:Disulfide bond formation protein B n=1 Tax=Castellaniella daejeonensis TaxID=659013 RepID=A0ABN0TPZ5_9BURK